ncbi:hypothetical protein GIB67_030231 [Kingdonia uniflora]|uniref:RRM domain-containing protein n=1 Tax=Kingdonia uniflora TaxID=39325 RepID=A0A7J7MND7_9MAGN|nr:hypothetical protein GIB67_030231 [Kingdonia uniflora]
MSKVSRQKEKYSNDTELSRDKANEGTSARTRAFSFGQIMERRKKKVVGYEEPEKILKRDKVEDVVDHAEANGDYRQSKGSVIGSKKHVSEDITKKTYRKKEENRDLEYNKKRDSGNKDKESRDSEYTKKRDSEKKDKESHDSEYTRKKDSEKKDKENRVSEAKLTEKFDIDMHSKAKGDRKDKRLFRSSNREYSRDVVEDESKKKHLEKSEKHRDKEREKNEREVKRKHISNDDGKSRPDIDDVNVAKKHNSGKRYDLTPAEGTGRKKETLQSHHGEARPKRRRSRSRESRDARDRDRHTHHGREHGDSLKDRRSDVDKNRTSNNGGYTNVQNRHPGGQRSGLGGYSPRKRRSDAAIKTPSPTARSPERIGAGWDLPPTGADTSGMSRHTVSSKASISLSESSPKTSSMSKNISINSAQLTHASLPSRTLYVENLPAAASDKFVMECLNSFLMSSGVSFNQGSQPCISCNINKAKGEALVEFLSQEVARAALSFDGRSIYGSIIRIRHPKDFVEATTNILQESLKDSRKWLLSERAVEESHTIYDSLWFLQVATPMRRHIH